MDSIIYPMKYLFPALDKLVFVNYPSIRFFQNDVLLQILPPKSKFRKLATEGLDRKQFLRSL